jgi:hypothetical protein
MVRAIREIGLKIIVAVLKLAGRKPARGWQRSTRGTDTRGA